MRLRVRRYRGQALVTFDELAASIPAEWRLSTLCEPEEINRLNDRDDAKAIWGVTLSHRTEPRIPIFGGGAPPTEALEHALERLNGQVS
jgi:hypothetical protein